jgi:hypothetical protein
MSKINCGKCKVNKRFRIILTSICRKNEIKEGDEVKVWIEKVEKREGK